ncbi:4'-phosphopantetheinyl transferase family protein [Kluyvera sp. NPDC087067]|uniref:4'-phosphopantetheinyl transferase family protein n=1 Tax=Kluyvera sp. NPDC087067 TaxID=3364105 RepID=UPI0038171128
MATHFARGILKDGHLLSVRLSSTSHNIARKLPAYRRTRYLASRALLAELLFMLYGISELPEIVTTPEGKPFFKDSHLPDFSIAYAGNIVGVALTTEGRCGLDMELLHVLRNTPQASMLENYQFTSNEQLWINNQSDPHEARVQLVALRQSVLKMTGDIHLDSPRTLQLLPGSGRLRSANTDQLEVICDAEDVLVWSLAASPSIDKLKVWEFDGKYGWRSLPDALTRANEPSARVMRFTSLPTEKALILN